MAIGFPATHPGSLCERERPSVASKGLIPFYHMDKKKLNTKLNDIILVFTSFNFYLPPNWWNHPPPEGFPACCNSSPWYHLRKAHIFLVDCCVHHHWLPGTSLLGILFLKYFYRSNCCLRQWNSVTPSAPPPTWLCTNTPLTIGVLHHQTAAT